MRLLLDIGNSRVKWGVLSDQQIRSGESFSSNPETLDRELARAWQNLDVPRAVYASNVAGEVVAERLRAAVQARWALPIRFAVTLSEAYGVRSGYDQPERLGVDRWLALVALRRDFSLPACVADCGTALTFDALDGEGTHLGGLIAPGLRLLQETLLRQTHGVRDPAKPVAGLLGHSTGACVTGGALGACAGLIERTWRALTLRLGRAPTVVLTGGDAAVIGEILEINHVCVPDLVLRGLSIEGNVDL